MSNNYQDVSLKSIGISDRQYRIYILLTEYGVSSVVQLAKYSGFSRPAIYRAIEQLIKKGLVESIVDGKRTIFKAQSPNTLNKLLKEKEKRIHKVAEELPQLIDSLEEFGLKRKMKSYVTFYSGIEGIKQVMWNTLKTVKKGEVLGYNFLYWKDIVGMEFSDTLHAEWINKKYRTYELTNLMEEGDVWSINNEGILSYDKLRYIDPKILAIKHETFIYEKCFSMIHYENGEYFGAEIYNEEIVNLQKQLFWMAWEKGEDMTPFKKFKTK